MAEKLVKLPNGTAGIVLSATNESLQEDLFFPCDNRLFAVNVNGDPECGSLVYDLNENSEPDRDRGARLQSAFRVIKEPMGFDNAIAYQLGPTGKGDAECGFFFDIPTGGSPQNLAAQMGSYRWQGFFHPGHKDDKHKLGEDADSNPINPAHIWIKSLFYKNKDEDGELLEEKIKKPIGHDLGLRIPVHFSWDKEIEKWRWWTTTPLQTIPAPLEPSTDPRHTGGDGPGVISNPLANTSTTGVIVSPPAPAISTLGQGGFQGTGGFINPDGSVTTFEPLTIQQSSTTGNPMSILASFGSALAAPATVFRPQNYSTGNADGLFQTQPSDTAKSKADQKANASPLTGMCSAFGAQGGVIGGSTSSGASHTNSEGDPWNLTSVPFNQNRPGKQTSKYPGGTATGGIVYHPPETDLRDTSVGMAPNGVTLSTMYVLAAPNAYFGCGVPELVTGAIKDGYSWGVDATTGDLLFRSHSASAAPVSAMTFTKTSQNIRWYSAKSFYGEIDHANTANQVYTFPDLTGTVVLTTSPASGLFTTGSVIFAASDGSLTQNNGSFFWDNANLSLTVKNSLGVGQAISGATLLGALGSETIASGASATWDGISFITSAATLTGNTNITTATGFNFFSVAQPSISAANAITITNAATMTILGAPVGGGAGPVTITNPYALWVQGGAALLAGWLNVGTTAKAIAQGDFSAGAGVSSIYYKQSSAIFQFGGSTGFQILDDPGSNAASVLDFDFGTNITTQSVTHRFHRSTNTSGNVAVQIFKGNGTGTIQHLLGGNVDSYLCSEAARSLGIGTTSPRRTIDILNTSNPQLRLTYTDNSVFVDQQCKSDGILYISPSGTGTYFQQTVSGGTVDVQITNLSNTASSDARLILQVAGTSAGNPFTRYIVGGTSWTLGINNGASQKFCIGQSATVGGNDYIAITTAGSVILNNGALGTTATDGFLYVASCAGTPTGTPTAFTGRVPIIVDTTNGKFWAYYGGAWHFAALT